MYYKYFIATKFLFNIYRFVWIFVTLNVLVYSNLFSEYIKQIKKKEEGNMYE